MWLKFWIVSLIHLIKWDLRALCLTGSTQYSSSFENFTWTTSQRCHFVTQTKSGPRITFIFLYSRRDRVPWVIRFHSLPQLKQKNLEGRQGKEKQKMRHKYKPLICLSITLISFLIFKDHSLTLERESESYLKFQVYNYAFILSRNNHSISKAALQNAQALSYESCLNISLFKQKNPQHCRDTTNYCTPLNIQTRS